VLFGSGETTRTGGRIFEVVAQRLARLTEVAVLETPAGFEPNSAHVAGRVAEAVRQRLQDRRLDITIVPARKRGTAFSPDDPEVTRPLLSADMIFFGPGSPTYTIRQLRDSLAWHRLMACNRHGAAIVLASAAVIAIGRLSLPVYEIYKCGEDLHWREGLDFFGAYGLALVFVPHWNNTEGGRELDTSRCFMGRDRFAELLALLPSALTVVGIDERTALIVDLAEETCRVLGIGGVTVVKGSHEQYFGHSETFAVGQLGPFRYPEPVAGIPPEVWAEVSAVRAPDGRRPLQPPPEVLALVEERQRLRTSRDWAAADELRRRVRSMGWEIRDTPGGPVVLARPDPSPQ